MKMTILIIAAFLGLAATAQARHSDLGQPDRMTELSHALQEAAHHAHETAEEYAHHYGESRVLRALHTLDQQARHFHRRVERYYQDPYHIEKDYRELIRAYRTALYAIQHLHTYEHVYDDFYRVEVLLGYLAYYYGGNHHDRGHDYEQRYNGGRHYQRPHRGRTRISFRWRN